jgi:hypothetical protein
MARQDPSGQLSNIRDSLRFAFAVPADDEDLRRLLRETPMRGSIEVGFTHEPDYFLGTGIAGAEDRTLLARENGRLVAAGRCITRNGWLNGDIRRIAYLGELRLAASAQGRWDIFRGGYTYFAAEYARNPADYCFTSIIVDNIKARRLLERGARNLPHYELIGEYVTLLIPTRGARPNSQYAVSTGADLPLEHLADFLNDSARLHHLATHWTPDILLGLAAHGLRLEDFVVLRQDTELVACAGVWNQDTFRQTQIHGYHPLLAATRPFYNLLAPLLRQPQLPRPGAFLKHALLTPFACRAGHADAVPALLQTARRAASLRGLNTVALGGVPGVPHFGRLRGRRYLSRLYRVDWPGLPLNATSLDARPCLPDIGLL